VWMPKYCLFLRLDYQSDRDEISCPNNVWGWETRRWCTWQLDTQRRSQHAIWEWADADHRTRLPMCSSRQDFLYLPRWLKFLLGNVYIISWHWCHLEYGIRCSYENFSCTFNLAVRLQKKSWKSCSHNFASTWIIMPCMVAQTVATG
jgi:hypothetical protein